MYQHTIPSTSTGGYGYIPPALTSDNNFSSGIDQIEDGEVNQMSGYLWKLSSRGSWQQRYFETNGNYLTYYKTHNMDKLKAAVNMPQVGEIKIVGEIEDTNGYGAVFIVELKDRKFKLRTETMSEAERWVKHLIFLRDGPNCGLGKVENPIYTEHNIPGAEQKRPLSSGQKSSHFSSIDSSRPRQASALLQKSSRSPFACCIRI